MVTALSTAHAAVFVGATLQADRRAELAIDVHRATGIVIAAVGAGPRVIRFVDAAFQPCDIADGEALAIHTADLARVVVAFRVGAARVFPIRNAVDTATPPAGSAAFSATLRPAFEAELRRQVSRISRCAFVDYFGAGVDRRIGGCSFFRRWRLFRRRRLLRGRSFFRRRHGLIYRRGIRRRSFFDWSRFLDHRIDRHLGLGRWWLFVLRIRLAAAKHGDADKSTEESLEYKATR